MSFTGLLGPDFGGALDAYFDRLEAAYWERPAVRGCHVDMCEAPAPESCWECEQAVCARHWNADGLCPACAALVEATFAATDAATETEEGRA